MVNEHGGTEGGTARYNKVAYCCGSVIRVLRAMCEFVHSGPLVMNTTSIDDGYDRLVRDKGSIEKIINSTPKKKPLQPWRPGTPEWRRVRPRNNKAWRMGK